MNKNSKRALALGASAAVLASAGVAYAYWSTTGSGSGSAATSAGQTGNLTFSPTTTDGVAGHSVSGIAPAVASAFQSTVTNTSPESAYVTQVKAYLTVVKDANAPAGTCDATDYTIGKDAAHRAIGTVVASNATDAQKDAAAVLLSWTPQELAQNGTGVAAGSIGFNDKADTGSALNTPPDFVSGNQDGCKGATVTLHYLAS